MATRRLTQCGVRGRGSGVAPKVLLNLGGVCTPESMHPGGRDLGVTSSEDRVASSTVTLKPP